MRSPGCACATPTDLSRCSSDTTWPAAALPADTIASRSPGTARGSSGRLRVVVSASGLFSDHLGQDLLVQRQIRDRAFEPRILFLQLTQLGHAQVRHPPRPSGRRCRKIAWRSRSSIPPAAAGLLRGFLTWLVGRLPSTRRVDAMRKSRADTPAVAGGRWQRGHPCPMRSASSTISAHTKSGWRGENM